MRVESFGDLPSGGEFDFVVVGSGFGGSVAALRLAEKGYSVAVLEAGRHFRDQDFAKTNLQLSKTFWAPSLFLKGIMRLNLLKHGMILSGAGVGGGSLVYANTLLEPGDAFYDSPTVRALAPDLRARLRPHFETAKRILGAATAPALFPADEGLRRMAEDSGRGATFHKATVGVFFGEPGKTVADPYFGGEGPERAGCIHCGACMVGCRHNAKNTLAKNYLPLAVKKGARIFALSEVRRIEETREGFLLSIRKPAWGLRTKTLTARRLVVSAGVLGTHRLLLDPENELPRLPARLGRDVRTNSEAILGLADPRQREDVSKGLAIAAGYWPDDQTHVEAVRFPDGSNALAILSLPLTKGRRWWQRLATLAWRCLTRPRETLRIINPSGWARRTTILLVMQTRDSRMRLGISAGKLQSASEPGSAEVSASAPAAEEALARYCERTGDVPLVTTAAAFLDISTTAHILGGAVMGTSPDDGVTGLDAKVFGYDNLWILDGSIVPANLGVNPSLTITALAEHAMSQVPRKEAA